MSGGDGAERRGNFARPALIDDKPSLAVLPFTNWSSDPEQEYFADGITEDLTTELSRLPGLFVISRHSAFVYKGVAKGAAEISAELGVRYLVEGSVRRCDRQMRISAQLIDAQSGAHTWAERYDRELKDIFQVQDDVIRNIVDALQVKLTLGETEDLGIEGTQCIEAYEMLLRGRERFFVFTREASRESKAFYRKALDVDPGYATAHAWLARSYLMDWAMDWETNPCVLEISLEHALKAIELDYRLPIAHAMLGFAQMWRKQGEAAIAAGRRAVELDPNNADAHLFLSFSFASCAHGEEGLLHAKKAIRLNPHPSPIYLLALGVCYYILGEYERAIEAHERGAELDRSYEMNLRLLIVLYALVGRDDDARRVREELVRTVSGDRAEFATAFWIDEAMASREERDRQYAWSL